jgi:hypothetical protein
VKLGQSSTNCCHQIALRIATSVQRYARLRAAVLKAGKRQLASPQHQLQNHAAHEPVRVQKCSHSAEILRLLSRRVTRNCR